MTFAFSSRWGRILLAWVLLASPALAADPKPDASLKNKMIEANVFLDDKIKADPALAADCLAEGRKWLDKNAADAAREKEDDPQLFRATRLVVRAQIQHPLGGRRRYVSVVRNDYMDTHGAHPNTDVNTVLWDKTENKRISIRPFFTETAGPAMTAMQKAVSIASLKSKFREKEARRRYATPEYSQGGRTKALEDRRGDPCPLDRNRQELGLTLHYPPYAVGPYAEGQYVALVPWETLKPFLTPEGQRIFGGARPKGDADNEQ